jgi:serine/threonine protein phosphatase PrpC
MADTVKKSLSAWTMAAGVAQLLVKKIQDPMAAAKQLSSQALNQKSKDDISCIVVRFR